MKMTEAYSQFNTLKRPKSQPSVIPAHYPAKRIRTSQSKDQHDPASVSAATSSHSLGSPRQQAKQPERSGLGSQSQMALMSSSSHTFESEIRGKNATDMMGKARSQVTRKDAEYDRLSPAVGRIAEMPEGQSWRDKVKSAAEHSQCAADPGPQHVPRDTSQVKDHGPNGQMEAATANTGKKQAKDLTQKSLYHGQEHKTPRVTLEPAAPTPAALKMKQVKAALGVSAKSVAQELAAQTEKGPAASLQARPAPAEPSTESVFIVPADLTIKSLSHGQQHNPKPTGAKMEPAAPQKAASLPPAAPTMEKGAVEASPPAAGAALAADRDVARTAAIFPAPMYLEDFSPEDVALLLQRVFPSFGTEAAAAVLTHGLDGRTLLRCLTGGPQDREALMPQPPAGIGLTRIQLYRMEVEMRALSRPSMP